VGVIAPFFLGWGTAYYFWDQLEALVDPGMRVAMAPYAMYVQIFIGAVLCATSVGITARVLKDLRRVQTAEARIILGAAVIDDVLGLIVLAVCVGMVGAVSGGAEQLSLFNILKIVGISMGFFVAMIGLGPYVLIPLFKYAARLRIRGLLLTLALVVCFFSSWLASWIGLAPIVGAFASGLILEEVHFRYLPEHRERKIEDLIIPLTTFLTPIFFVRMGITVDLGAFGNVAILGFALALSASAILGKQVCAFGVLQRGVDRLAVGLGMIPRGEVGLIFANEGTKLTIGRFPVIDPNVLSAVVIMVMITTVVTPPVLKWRFKQLPVSGPPPVVHEPPSEGPPL
jgi:Kef-type K+ transport system membrane component KefB